MREKMLLIGGSGFLGLNWQHYNSFYDITATYNSYLPNLPTNWVKFTFDGSNISDLEKIISITNPKVIVNCAAITNVEFCDRNRSLAKLINTDFPRELAILANKSCRKFVHISTDHYQSESESPRSEDDDLVSVNVYGQTKLAAEKFIIQECPDALVLRVNFFGYGPRRNPSLLDQILLNLSTSQKFYGFTDVHFNPISTKELVMSVNKLIERESNGIFNIASSNVISKYEFAKKVCKVFHFDSEFVVESESDVFDSRTKRPKYLALNAAKFNCMTGIMCLSIDDMLIDLKSDTIWRQYMEATNA